MLFRSRLVSATMVIVIAISAITGLMVPKLSVAVIVMRFIIIICASIIGFYGVFFALLGLLIYVLSLESFGIQYTAGTMSIKLSEQKDSFIRAPVWAINLRTKFINRDIKRNK